MEAHVELAPVAGEELRHGGKGRRSVDKPVVCFAKGGQGAVDFRHGSHFLSKWTTRWMSERKGLEFDFLPRE